MSKKHLKLTLIFIVLFLPSLLCFNESDTIIPNIVGAFYLLAIVVLMKTNLGEKIKRFINNFINN